MGVKIDVAPKDSFYEAVNHRNPFHASRVKIVQRSGIIVKRAMHIVIKSGPWVIIRAREIDSKGGAFEKHLADQQGASCM